MEIAKNSRFSLRDLGLQKRCPSDIFHVLVLTLLLNHYTLNALNTACRVTRCHNNDDLSDRFIVTPAVSNTEIVVFTSESDANLKCPVIHLVVVGAQLIVMKNNYFNTNLSAANTENTDPF
jgi:hypothetical protein